MFLGEHLDIFQPANQHSLSTALDSIRILLLMAALSETADQLAI